MIYQELEECLKARGCLFIDQFLHYLPLLLTQPLHLLFSRFSVNANIIMVVIYTSTTVPINSFNEIDPLTSAEFWKVLEHKCRNPLPFVKPITRCRITSEDHDYETGQLTGLTRWVVVNGENAEVEEVAVLKKPVMVRLSIDT